MIVFSVYNTSLVKTFIFVIKIILDMCVVYSHIHTGVYVCVFYCSVFFLCDRVFDWSQSLPYFLSVLASPINSPVLLPTPLHWGCMHRPAFCVGAGEFEHGSLCLHTNYPHPFPEPCQNISAESHQCDFYIQLLLPGLKTRHFTFLLYIKKSKPIN